MFLQGFRKEFIILLSVVARCDSNLDVERSLQQNFADELENSLLIGFPPPPPLIPLSPSPPSPPSPPSSPSLSQPSTIEVPSSTISFTSSPTLYPQNTCFFTNQNDNNCQQSIVSDSPLDDRTMDVDSYICSPNKQYKFGITSDRLICLCDGIRKTWCAEVDKRMQADAYLRLRSDGCLSGYNNRFVGRSTVWKTIEDENGVMLPAFNREDEMVTMLQLTDDGDLSLVDVTDVSFPLWEPDLSAYEPYVPPTSAPTTSRSPTGTPTISSAPTKSQAPSSVERTYFPGELIQNKSFGLQVSKGLRVRIIGRTGNRAMYGNGMSSLGKVHDQPDAGGCFDQPDGGWIYVSNSEVDKKGGGVGAFTFNSNGDLMNYKMVQTGSNMNCGGGKTPWGTWFSGEETPQGWMWEVDINGNGARMTQFGIGRFESAACDDRDMSQLSCFASLDHESESIRRYQPNPQVLQDSILNEDYSDVMHAEGGTLSYLFLNSLLGTFTWTTNKFRADSNAKALFPNVEGIDHHDGKLYFVSKITKELFTLDLDSNTYEKSNTASGAFNHQPDQIKHIIGNDPSGNAFLYFLEDGGGKPGVFARNLKNNNVYTVLEKIEDKFDGDEATGLAFCDNYKRLIVAMQERGTIYEFTRDDGQPFYGAAANVKYHQTSTARSGSTNTHLRASMDE